MGLVQSVFCAMTFCVERILTWICCAFVLIALIFALLMLMVYGISVGYHYAQKELTDFAYFSRAEPGEQYHLRTGRKENENIPVSTNIPNEEDGNSYEPRPVLEAYQTQKPEQQVYRQPLETPIVLLATERSQKEHDLAAHERALARKLIGRFRRSRKNIPKPTRHFHKALKHSNSTISHNQTMAFT
ncbi:unnamed protein product [Spodoptera littoralis]|uniref:Uncharacterized protein n=1 Tax=Spodoptera littoralis TaxID=7109 RepID=A0A9P0I251_SPOLI|nr:unnamed protein product [Spodoptera littoralis]CAH1638323.1 unnamed protein product [Spodoptera littoralis]